MDPRVEELHRLRFALASFALQLDAFEARLKSRSSETTMKPSRPTASETDFASKIVSAMKSADATGQSLNSD
jgi:hypothetical protein